MKCLVLVLFCFLGLGQEPIFVDEFESGTLNPAFWRSSSSGDGIVEVSTNAQGTPSAHYGNYAIIMGKRSDGTTMITNNLDLHLNLSGYNQVDLSFWIRDLQDESSPNEGIWLSEDGAHFVKVFNFDLGKWPDSYGKIQHLDIDELAIKAEMDLGSRFVIRFVHECIHDFLDANCCDKVDGLLIDDVLVSSPTLRYASLPFHEDFESGTLGPHWAWAMSDGMNVHPQDFVEILSELSGNPIGLEGFSSLAFGRWSVDGINSTQRMDLHLNLANQENVYLSFSIGGLSEDTHAGDGIWMSDDGGLTFVKAFQFRGSDWDSVAGRLPPLNLSELARKQGLEMTAKFVLRFQHHSWGDAIQRGCCDEQEALLIDDIRVYSKPELFQVPPVSEGFESTLGPGWRYEYPSQTTSVPFILPSSIARPHGHIQGIQAAASGFRGLVFGKDFDGKATTNAIDLYLDLSGATNYDLAFKSKGFDDESDPEDGIWFSADGGTTFSKVWDFNFASLNAATWTDVQLDVDALANSAGIGLSGRFVVRFQQKDDKDFEPGCCGDRDGWILDDVIVKAASGTGRKFNSVVPWVVNNANFTSKLSFCNDSGTQAQVILTALDREGQSRVRNIEVPPRGLVTLNSSDLFNLSGYSLFIEADNAEVYTNFLTIEAKSGKSSPSLAEAFFVEDLEPHLLFGYLPGDQTSAIVLTAPAVNSGSSEVHLALYRANGTEAQSVTVTLVGRRPAAFLVSDLFPSPHREAVAIKASSLSGVDLAGTTFVFNLAGDPSMSSAIPRPR